MHQAVNGPRVLGTASQADWVEKEFIGGISTEFGLDNVVPLPRVL